MDVETRLRNLDDGQLEIIRRLDKIDGELSELQDMVHDTVIEIGGVPDEIGRDPSRHSLRWRVHKIESDRAAADAATAAVTAARELRVAASEKRFSKREKLVGLAFAFMVAVSPYLAPLLYHH